MEIEASRSWTPDQRLILNVGGARHEVLWKTLNKIPNSRLGHLIHTSNKDELHSLCDGFNLNTAEFYFDRDPTLFNFILNYYRIGKLHINDDICPVMLDRELCYWCVHEPKMDLCCEEKLFKKQKDIDYSTLKYQNIIREEKLNMREEMKINASKFGRLKRSVWNVVDNPFETSSSTFSKVHLDYLTPRCIKHEQY